MKCMQGDGCPDLTYPNKHYSAKDNVFSFLQPLNNFDIVIFSNFADLEKNVAHSVLRLLT